MTNKFPATEAYLISIFGDQLTNAYGYLKNVMFNREDHHPTLCLQGENPSGKSTFGTLMKILDPGWGWNITSDGVVPNEGYIWICDEYHIRIGQDLIPLHHKQGSALVLICAKFYNEEPTIGDVWLVNLPGLKELSDQPVIERMISERNAFLSFLYYNEFVFNPILSCDTPGDESGANQSSDTAFADFTTSAVAASLPKPRIEDTPSQRKRIGDELSIIRAKVTMKDREDFMQMKQLSARTISNYMNKGVLNADTGIQMLVFFRQRIASRKNLIKRIKTEA